MILYQIAILQRKRRMKIGVENYSSRIEDEDDGPQDACVSKTLIQFGAGRTSGEEEDAER